MAARHLVHFGLKVTVVYPKHSSKPHFINLVRQCEDLGIPILDAMPIGDEIIVDDVYDGIVDAIFGFSFTGSAPREPYATAIASMVKLQQSQKSILISVDVPSGWDVDGGDLTCADFHPDVLVSLTAPKLSAKKFRGRHFIGGRFLPPAMAEKYGIRVSVSCECILQSCCKWTSSFLFAEDIGLFSLPIDWCRGFSETRSKFTLLHR